MDTSNEFSHSVSRPKVLFICDRPDELASWQRILPGDRLELILAATVEEAFANWPEYHPDLIVVDVNDARPDCTETCRRLRQEAAVPLVVLFGNVDEDCLLRAYRAGADDCLVKPVSPPVFLAKLQAWLKRSWAIPLAVLPDLEAGGLRLDMRRRQVIIQGEKVARLTNLEFRLLSLLMSNPDRVLQPEDLVLRVWGFSGGAEAGVILKNLVYRLRKKIEPDPAHPSYLLTEPGLGYRFRKS